MQATKTDRAKIMRMVSEPIEFKKPITTNCCLCGRSMKVAPGGQTVALVCMDHQQEPSRTNTAKWGR